MYISDVNIKNDDNLYTIEIVSNTNYPSELLQRIITASLKTMKIVNALPALDID